MSQTKRFTASAAAITALLAAGAVVAACGGSSNDKTKPNAVDRAFASQMIDHHQMAIDMANVAQNRAQHRQIKTTANNIVRTQTAEIDDLTGLAKTDGADMSSGGHQMNDGSNTSNDSMSGGNDMGARSASPSNMRACPWTWACSTTPSRSTGLSST